MKRNRILSTALALVIGLSSVCVFTVPASAAIITNVDKTDNEGNPLINYMEDGYGTREEKLKDMMEVKTVNGYKIWYESYTGEVAIEELETGNVLFTNPYDVSDNFTAVSDAAKEQLLSQIILTYLDNETPKTMYSFVEAAQRSQIQMKDIKNGIRVEYTIGEDAVQRLVPRMISVDRYNKYILDPLKAAAAAGDYDAEDFLEYKLPSYMELKDKNDPDLSERGIREMQKAFPIVDKMAVYVCDTNIKPAELKRLENVIKKYCPLYTYEELEYDNQETGFVNNDKNPPRFSMALEYTLTDNGVEVSLPANGISFDESLYQLQDVSILPYMGAGSIQYKGYTFLPDGSGAIFRYEELRGVSYKMSAQMYGMDYAYHDIEGKNVEAMRFPVFGAVTNYSVANDVSVNSDKLYSDAGFAAIITEGDAMATLTTEHGGTLHPYNSVYATFTPRPSDTYNLEDSISVSGSAEWTVTSSRRYTGSYKIRYIMLSNEEDGGSGYEPSYFGMAEAYRDYLSEDGKITKLDSSSVDSTLPLYIESFGSMKGTKRVLSFPVTVDIPLTTFEDVQTMSEELSDLGMDNINFKLTGFANGGLDATIPAKLKWQKGLGGSSGYRELTEYAAEHGIGIYPEFDFAYINARDTFDGVSMKTQAIKTIDNRYAQKQLYDGGFQTFMPSGSVAISPSVYENLWSKFSKKFDKFDNNYISMSTIGSDLNSDFDEDDPSHREDNKAFTEDFLSAVSDSHSVMVSGGNAYSVPYSDIITDVSLTSSKYLNSSESVPFAGIVLHGSKIFTGTPINMEGDISEAILNSIENGSSPLFTLSYQNTQDLKSDEKWSKYYSIAYDIWKDDVAKYYGILNDALGNVQDSYIVEHDFIDATRIPDEDERLADETALREVEAKNAEARRKADEEYQTLVRRYARLGLGTPERIKAEETELDITSKYKTESGSVVHVGYENGVEFILNYNSYDITVELDGNTYTVPAMNFEKIG